MWIQGEEKQVDPNPTKNPGSEFETTAGSKPKYKTKYLILAIRGWEDAKKSSFTSDPATKGEWG